MSTPRRQRGDTLDSNASSTNTPRDDQASYLTGGAVPNPTYASFSPMTLSTSTQPVSAAKRLSTILVHQKSPLLLATPPQVTRALAYSHPFLLPLNKLAGLLTWTTGDAWESFLLVAVFWAVVLYGDAAIRFAGPVLLVLLLIGGMYGRRFSPLSSSGWSEDGGAGGGATPRRDTKSKGKPKGRTQSEEATAQAGGEASVAGAAGTQTHNRGGSEATSTRHQKTLDEIVETVKEFTARCNILLEPLLELTDFLSTQRTATSATTRPALTTLFVRILLCTPFWVALTLPPLKVVTARRVILVFGTVVLTWHARVVKAGRTILWRSASLRKLASLLTGLQIAIPKRTPASEKKDVLVKTKGVAVHRESDLTKAIRRARGATDAGVRFTFIIYENQRRWVGLGWTNSLFAYERAAWTDEHNNAVTPKDKFELPDVEDDSRMRWRWVDGSRWRVDGVPDEAVSVAGENGASWDYDSEGGKNGWVYYDNKWQNGRRGQDGWGRWTRRRKWYRDAELVEIDSDEEGKDVDEPTPTGAPGERAPALPPRPKTPTLAPPYITTSESMSMPDLLSGRTGTMKNIKEEAEDECEKADDASSVMSTSSRSTSRFKVPPIRRRGQRTESQGSKQDYNNLNSSPRSASLSAYSVGSVRSRRMSEDDEASLGPQVGLQIARDRTGEAWGVGDEVVMGLE